MKTCLMVVLIALFSMQAKAFNWSDFWFTADQQAQSLMDKGQFSKAKDTFLRSDWAAAAAYKSGDYERAAGLFEGLKTEQGYYNQGNALAHMGKYEQAIAAYDKALAINPKDQDALYNRKLVSDLLKKDKDKKQNKDQENKDQKNKDQKNKDQKNKDQKSKDQENKDQENKDQKNKDQENKDQKNKDQKNKDQKNKKQENKTQQNPDKKSDKKHNEAVQSEEDREKQQAKEQWLRLIPDDPGGLIREKFLRDHIRRQRGWYE